MQLTLDFKLCSVLESALFYDIMNLYKFEVGMTMEDYIVLADIPKIQLESEEELPVLRKRNQSPSPCREQKLRTHRLVLKNEDDQCVTCTQIKPKYSGYERCLLAPEMSFTPTCPIAGRPQHQDCFWCWASSQHQILFYLTISDRLTIRKTEEYAWSLKRDVWKLKKKSDVNCVCDCV